MAQDLFPEPRMRRQSNYRRDGNCQVLPADSSITAAAFAAKRSYFAHQPQADEASACGYPPPSRSRLKPIKKSISLQCAHGIQARTHSGVPGEKSYDTMAIRFPSNRVSLLQVIGIP